VAIQAGSVSVTLAGKVRLKLLPAREHDVEVVQLGVADVEHPQSWFGEPSKLGTINQQPFWFITLPCDHARAIERAEGIYEYLRARHDKLDA
jgi:hypothetical protein